MLYRITQAATIVTLVSVLSIWVVPRDYRLYPLAVAAISTLILFLFAALILVAPKRWRE